MLLSVLMAVLLPAAQSAAPEGISISIKPGANKAKVVLPLENVFFARGANVIDALAYAFEIEPRQLLAPQWLRELNYDFDAASRTGAGGAGVRAAFRQALAAKFSLAWHWEPRDLEYWVLSAPGQATALKPAPLTGGFQSVNPSMGIACRPCSTATVAELLKQALDIPVLNETGLKGSFDIAVQWNGREPNEIARAMREQTGLSLEKQWRRTDVLVIDAAVRPEDAIPLVPPPSDYACAAEPEIRAAIDSLPPAGSPTLSFEQIMTPRRALARRFPNDVFVQMAVQDAFRLKPEMADEWDRALAFYAALDDPVLGPFLEARLRLRLQRALSRRLLARVIERAPDFPWAHLALAEWAGLPDREDEGLRAHHLGEFRRLCPESLAALPYYPGDGDVSLAADATSRLWPVLISRTDPEAIAGWPRYWNLLARVLPEDRLRNRVNLDVSALRWMDRRGDPAWAEAIRYGYKLAGNEAALKAFDAEAGPEPAPRPPEPSPLETARDRAGISRALQEIEKRERYRRESDVPAEREAAEKRIAAAYARAKKILVKQGGGLS